MVNTRFSSTITTADISEKGELFGVHIPELQLSIDDYRNGFISANLSTKDKYLELGSGHGVGIILAAHEFGVVKATGVEYLDHAIEHTLEKAKRSKVADRVEIKRADLRFFDLKGYDVIYMHLGPAFHDVLAARFEEQLSPSTRVIAAGWSVPGWKPIDQDKWDSGYIYHPADPIEQLSLNLDSAHLQKNSVLVDLYAHADLENIEVIIELKDDSKLQGVCSSNYAYRGQTITTSITVREDIKTISVTAQGRDKQIKQRGTKLDYEKLKLALDRLANS